MKSPALLLIWMIPTLLPAAAADEPESGKVAEHQEGAKKLSDQQDELAADVQQLMIEQTHPKVIEMLEAVEEAMDEASELLLEHDTGGTTIAAETEVIERIFDAAKERQRQSGGSGEAGGAMLEMMEQMMGRGQEGKEGKGQKGEGTGNQGGEGKTGESDTANTPESGATGGKREERRVPKASGKAGRGIPPEFQDAMDAYNRAAEQLAR